METKYHQKTLELYRETINKYNTLRVEEYMKEGYDREAAEILVCLMPEPSQKAALAYILANDRNRTVSIYDITI